MTPSSIYGLISKNLLYNKMVSFTKMYLLEIDFLVKEVTHFWKSCLILQLLKMQAEKSQEEFCSKS